MTSSLGDVLATLVLERVDPWLFRGLQRAAGNVLPPRAEIAFRAVIAPQSPPGMLFRASVVAQGGSAESEVVALGDVLGAGRGLGVELSRQDDVAGSLV